VEAARHHRPQLPCRSISHSCRFQMKAAMVEHPCHASPRLMQSWPLQPHSLAPLLIRRSHLRMLESYRLQTLRRAPRNKTKYRHLWLAAAAANQAGATPRMVAGSRCRLEACITRWQPSNSAGEAISSSSLTTRRTSHAQALSHQLVVVATISSFKAHSSRPINATWVELDAISVESKALISNSSSFSLRPHPQVSKAHRAPALCSCSSMQLLLEATSRCKIKLRKRLSHRTLSTRKGKLK